MSEVLFVVDEAPIVGSMPSINDAIGIGRGYGIRLQFYFQSTGQLKTCFPDGQEHTLLSNTSQIFFGVNDNATATLVSDRLGERTIVTESGGTGSGYSRQNTHAAQPSSSNGSSSNESHNWQQQARKLLKPEEVMALSPRSAITFVQGVPPIFTTLLRWDEEKHLGRKPGWGRGRITEWARLVRAAMWCALAIGMDAYLTSAMFRIPLGKLLHK